MSVQAKSLRKETALDIQNEDIKRNLEIQQAKDKELVKGLFKFYECPGGSLSFVYRKYKGEKVKRYDMVDNKVYTIPLGVAKHINSNIWYPVHAYATDENGAPSQRISQKIKRCGFQSLEFMDIDDFERGGQQIIKIENMAIPS